MAWKALVCSRIYIKEPNFYFLSLFLFNCQLSPTKIWTYIECVLPAPSVQLQSHFGGPQNCHLLLGADEVEVNDSS